MRRGLRGAGFGGIGALGAGVCGVVAAGVLGGTGGGVGLDGFEVFLLVPASLDFCLRVVNKRIMPSSKVMPASMKPTFAKSWLTALSKPATISL